MRKSAGVKMKSSARLLRRETTPEECVLWKRLRELNRLGFHFRRQVPFQNYIVDFIEHGCRLAIEIDGSQHGLPDHRERDMARDRLLAHDGYLVLRFWNVEIKQNIKGVMEKIFACAEARSPTRRARISPGPSDLPTRGR